MHILLRIFLSSSCQDFGLIEFSCVCLWVLLFVFGNVHCGAQQNTQRIIKFEQTLDSRYLPVLVLFVRVLIQFYCHQFVFCSVADANAERKKNIRWENCLRKIIVLFVYSTDSAKASSFSPPYSRSRLTWATDQTKKQNMKQMKW